MNKKLIGMITSALVIGTASVALANPFSDVPADHWAYDAIDQLAADGIIDGYGDTTYRGDNQITRYEMAQIVARAMANCEGQEGASKATVDKLAAEFSNELDALGVRVTKLENKVAGLKNITPYGQYRLRWNVKNGANGTTKLMNRIRFGFKGDINDDMTFDILYMYQNHNELGQDKNLNDLVVGNVQYKNLFKNTNLTVGRFCNNLGMSMYLYNTAVGADGVMLTHKAGKWDIDLGYADFDRAAGNGVGFAEGGPGDADRAFFVDAFYKPSDAWKFNAMYFNMDNENTKAPADKADTYSVGAEWQFAKNLYLMGEYAKNEENDAEGSVVRLRYNNVSAAKPGSWMFLVEHNDWDHNILGSKMLSQNSGECMGKAIGERNWQVQFDMAVAKNVVWQTWWAFDRDLREAGDDGDFIRTQVNFNF